MMTYNEALDDNKRALALAVQTAYADGQSIRELAAEYGPNVS